MKAEELKMESLKFDMTGKKPINRTPLLRCAASLSSIFSFVEEPSQTLMLDPMFAMGLLTGLGLGLDGDNMPDEITGESQIRNIALFIRDFVKTYVGTSLKPDEKCPGCGEIHDGPAVH